MAGDLPGNRHPQHLHHRLSGETERDFEELIQFLEDARSTGRRLCLFAGRGALRPTMPGLILPEDVREDRRRLMEVQEDISAEKLAAKIDSVIEVLVDGRRGRHDRPLVGRRAGNRRSGFHIDGHFDAQPGDFLQVKVIDADHHDLYAEIA